MRGAVRARLRLRRRAPPVRRRRSARSRRCSTCWPTPSSRWRARAASRCTRRGRSTRCPPTTRWPRPRWPRPTAPGPPARVCETAIQVHGGIGNTWECLAHVYLRRALLSSDVLGGAGRASPGCSPTTGSEVDRWTSVTRPPRRSSAPRLRAWLADNNPGLPASSTDDDYWAGQAAWHQSLYDAGFFGMSWPTEIGGQGLPSVYDVIVDDELAAAGAPPRPEPRLPRRRASSSTATTTSSSASSPASSTAATAGARASASPTPAPTSRRCAPAPTATATSTSSPATRSGRATPTTPTGASSSPAPTTTSPSTRASRRSPCRCDQPGIEQRPLRMINGITKEFGEVHLRRRPGAGREHDRRAGRGVAAGDDRRQPRARAGRARATSPATGSS